MKSLKEIAQSSPLKEEELQKIEDIILSHGYWHTVEEKIRLR